MLFLVFARPIAKLYISEDGELLDMTVFAIRMIALQAPLGGILQPRITYLQAVEHQIAMAVSEGKTNPEEKLGLKILGSMGTNIKYVRACA